MEISLRVARFHDFLSNGNRNLALLEIAQGQEEEPSAASVWLFLTGLFFLGEGFGGRALRSMEEAFRLEPQSREFLYGIAMANSSLGFYQEVLFCAKISSTTREIALEKGWGDILTPSMRSVDHLLMAVDENAVLLRIRDSASRGSHLLAARIAEDGLLAFEHNHAWRRAAIRYYLLANRPFSAVGLLASFASRTDLSVADQALAGDVFAKLGRIDDSLVWLSNAALRSSEEQSVLDTFVRIFSFSRPPLPQALLSMRDQVVEGLSERSRARGSKMRVGNRLRIGIVSSDLHVGGLIERVALLLEMFNKSNVEFFLYIDSNYQDSLTERFLALSKDHYVTHGLDDKTLAHILREDEIDIFLELDSFGIYRRPNVARLKPASLHVVAFGDPQDAQRWGYDAVLSDRFLSPLPTLTLASSKKGMATSGVAGEVIKEEAIDLTTPCPILRPPAGFLQVEDIFRVQPLSISRRRLLRVGISAPYAFFDTDTRALLVRCLVEVPRFELILDSDSIGGEQAAASLLSELERALTESEQSRIRVLPEHSSYVNFLSQIDIFLDASYPRSAYMFWQALRHGIASLTLSGDAILARSSLSIAHQMSFAEFCVCDDEDHLLSRLRSLCLAPSQLRCFRQALRRKKQPRVQQRLSAEKALSFIETLLEGVSVLGRRGRYVSPHLELN